MLPVAIISLERLGREIEDAEFRLKLWQDRLERASAVQQASFRMGTTTWSESREVLGRVQRVVTAMTDAVEALKEMRAIAASEKAE